MANEVLTCERQLSALNMSKNTKHVNVMVVSRGVMTLSLIYNRTDWFELESTVSKSRNSQFSLLEGDILKRRKVASKPFYNGRFFYQIKPDVFVRPPIHQKNLVEQISELTYSIFKSQKFTFWRGSEF